MTVYWPGLAKNVDGPKLILKTRLDFGGMVIQRFKTARGNESGSDFITQSPACSSLGSYAPSEFFISKLIATGEEL
jgi:hypothetical protein